MNSQIKDKFNSKNTKELYPLSGKGKLITCTPTYDSLDILWGDLKFEINYEAISDILDNFFKDENEWYPLGASMTVPITDGMGEYLKDNHKPLTPRHASAISSILVSYKLLECKGNKPIMLKKIG